MAASSTVDDVFGRPLFDQNRVDLDKPADLGNSDFQNHGEILLADAF
jgi:hypothetical protein